MQSQLRTYAVKCTEHHPVSEIFKKSYYNHINHSGYTAKCSLFSKILSLMLFEVSRFQIYIDAVNLNFWIYFKYYKMMLTFSLKTESPSLSEISGFSFTYNPEYTSMKAGSPSLSSSFPLACRFGRLFDPQVGAWNNLIN